MKCPLKPPVRLLLTFKAFTRCKSITLPCGSFPCILRAFVCAYSYLHCLHRPFQLFLILYNLINCQYYRANSGNPILLLASQKIVWGRCSLCTPCNTKTAASNKKCYCLLLNFMSVAILQGLREYPNKRYCNAMALQYLCLRPLESKIIYSSI